MTNHDPEPLDETPDEPDAVAWLPGTLREARTYWHNARTIGGEPGSPDMIQGAELQTQHAIMATAGALISIAQSLETIASNTATNQRKLGKAADSLHVVGKELNQMRLMVRRSR